jgi:hypothetical protein
MIPAGLQIAKRTHSIKVKLLKLGLSPSDASEMAFHMADMFEDICNLSTFIKKASGKDRITEDTLDAVLDGFEYHSYYHLKMLYRVAKRSRIRAERTEDLRKRVKPKLARSPNQHANQRNLKRQL